MASTLNDIAP